MATRLVTGICMSAALFALSAMPALAIGIGESRVISFSLGGCSGAGKSLALNATGFTPNSTEYIVGGAVNLSVASGTLKFLILGTPVPGSAKTILIMGTGDTSARFALPFSIPFAVATDASGNVPISIQGACIGGGTVGGFATVYFQ